MLGVEGDVVRIGISAPKHIDIFRKEVYLSIQDSNREAAAPVAGNLEAFMEKLRGGTQEN
ncbi:hypothetical protein D3C76_1788390 [compost metagenome]